MPSGISCQSADGVKAEGGAWPGGGRTDGVQAWGRRAMLLPRLPASLPAEAATPAQVPPATPA